MTLEEFNWPETNPEIDELILIDIGEDEGEFRWWLAHYNTHEGVHQFTSHDNGNELEDRLDLESFTWYRLPGGKAPRVSMI